MYTYLLIKGISDTLLFCSYFAIISMHRLLDIRAPIEISASDRPPAKIQINSNHIKGTKGPITLLLCSRLSGPISAIILHNFHSFRSTLGYFLQFSCLLAHGRIFIKQEWTKIDKGRAACTNFIHFHTFSLQFPAVFNGFVPSVWHTQQFCSVFPEEGSELVKSRKCCTKFLHLGQSWPFFYLPRGFCASWHMRYVLGNFLEKPAEKSLAIVLTFCINFLRNANKMLKKGRKHSRNCRIIVWSSTLRHQILAPPLSAPVYIQYIRYCTTMSTYS